MRSLLLLILAFLSFGFAPAPVFRERPNDPEAVLRRLQGRWRGVSYSRAGKDQLSVTPFHITVEKDHWRFFSGTDGRQTNAYTITLDTKVTPMRIDWRSGGTHLVGLFELSRDRFLYSYRVAGRGYPRSLTALEETDFLIEVVRGK